MSYKEHMKKLIPLLMAVLMVSCHTPASQNDTEGDTLELKYAKNLLMVEYERGIDVQLRNPWDTTQILHRYWLTEHASPSPFQGSTEVTVPLQKAGVFTAVHCALLCELGCQDAIAGVCEPEYIHNRQIHNRLQQGRIVDLGSGMNPNLERIMQITPDAVMPSPFQDNGGYGRLESIGIPIIECADYMEVSPLARAEWMKFYGILFGVREKADSLFATVESKYHAIQQKAKGFTQRPTLVVDRPYSGTWYIPGGQSTMGIMYQDAGADYLWADAPESGSLPLSPEQVLERAIQADIWIMKYNQEGDMSYAQLASDNPIFKEFKAYQQRRIYACNTHDIPFYEETPFHPERLLANLLQIFHPELSFSTNNSYFCSMKE